MTETLLGKDRDRDRSTSHRLALVKVAILLLTISAVASPALSAGVNYEPSICGGAEGQTSDNFAENMITPGCSSVANTTATLVTDPTHSTWYLELATRASASLPGGTLASGAAAMSWGGPDALEQGQWLLAMAGLDGVNRWFGYPARPGYFDGEDTGVSQADSPGSYKPVNSNGPDTRFLGPPIPAPEGSTLFYLGTSLLILGRLLSRGSTSY